MSFSFVDKIQSVENNKKILTSRCLTLNEEYFQDHFPKFPIMPGVLMLESLVQAATWLLHIVQKFSFSTFVLSEVQTVKYGQFVKPGDVLKSEVTLEELGIDRARFKGRGFVDGQSVLSSQFSVHFFNRKSINKDHEVYDRLLIERSKNLFALLNKSQIHVD
jgi:3-hydroxyacyl-[acyl-carrier-protein] dehydratase